MAKAVLLSEAGGELFSLRESHRVDGGQVVRMRQGGEMLAMGGPGSSGARLTSYMQGGHPVALASGKMGAMAVYRLGKWDYRLAPALKGETIAGGWVVADGTVYAAGVTHALYERRGDQWKTFRYPSALDPKILAIGGGAGNALYLLGREGLLWAFRKGRFEVQQVAGLEKGQLSETLDAAWYDPKTKRFWAVNKSTLLSIECEKKSVTKEKNRMFFDVAHMVGVRTNNGILLLLSTFGKTAIFDGKEWSLAHKDGANSAWVDVKQGHLYRTTTFKGVVVTPVKHPFLGTGKATPLK